MYCEKCGQSNVGRATYCVRCYEDKECGSQAEAELVELRDRESSAREMARVARDYRAKEWAWYSKWNRGQLRLFRAIAAVADLADQAETMRSALHDLTDLRPCPKCGAWTSPDLDDYFCDECAHRWSP
jgi:hypothetical protein